MIDMKSASRSRVVRFGAAVAAVLATGVLAIPALGAGAATSRCSTSQLRLRFVQSQAATGHRFIDYAFKNAGAAACSLRGYPSAVLLDKHGHVIQSTDAKVGHWTISEVRTVVISPGKRAFFTFTWVDGGFCPGKSFSFYSLRVSPPNNAAGFQQHLGKTPTCNGSAKVSAIRPKLSKL
jgi:hypothetical protein